MSEKITYKDSKGNAYEQVDCEGCHECDLDGSGVDCVDAPCFSGKGWKLVGEKIPDIKATLWSTIAACQRVRGHFCNSASFPCLYWTTKTCPSRKHLAALGYKDAWSAK